MKRPKPIKLTHDHALVYFFALLNTHHDAASAEGALSRLGHAPCASLHSLLADKLDALLCLNQAAGFGLHAPGF